MTKYFMQSDVKLTCSCGNVMELVIEEEYNNKDSVWCKCGKKYILLEVSEI